MNTRTNRSLKRSSPNTLWFVLVVLMLWTRLGATGDSVSKLEEAGKPKANRMVCPTADPASPSCSEALSRYTEGMKGVSIVEHPEQKRWQISGSAATLELVANLIDEFQPCPAFAGVQPIRVLKTDSGEFEFILMVPCRPGSLERTPRRDVSGERD